MYYKDDGYGVIRLDESRPHCGAQVDDRLEQAFRVIRLDESRPHCG